MRRILLAVPLLGLAACAPRAVAVVEPVPDPPEPPPPFPHNVAWTERPGLALRTEDGVVTVAFAHTRLEVLEADSATLRVRCNPCETPVEGWIGKEAVVVEAAHLEEAAWGDLVGFAAALRAAAAARDLAALRSVMAPEFTHSFVGLQGRDQAIAVWESEGFRTLDRVPDLLDEGLATRDEHVWAAPPAHLGSLGYQGLRLGLRRTEGGRWEWLFLIRGVQAGAD
jgi:tetrahydromethanopterin S-methyltransferase subunit B